MGNTDSTNGIESDKKERRNYDSQIERLFEGHSELKETQEQVIDRLDRQSEKINNMEPVVNDIAETLRDLKGAFRVSAWISKGMIKLAALVGAISAFGATKTGDDFFVWLKSLFS